MASQNEKAKRESKMASKKEKAKRESKMASKNARLSQSRANRRKLELILERYQQTVDNLL